MSIIESAQDTDDDAPSDSDLITAEVVAKTIAGIEQIGVAQRTLQQAGWTATIARNSITVNGVIEAYLHHQNGCGWWQVYATNGALPVWTVGARSGSDPSCWNGCLE
jgi:hypothetical protein